MDSNKNLFDFTAQDIDGKEVKFADFKGKAKAFLIVNVASACGLTDGNYKELTQLYTEYHPQGLEILAFPCNQFGSQEDKCNLTIKKFATDNYKVQFPIFNKIDVNGTGATPLFSWLRSQAKIEKIGWNFAKFLVDKEGHFVSYHVHSASPLSFKDQISALLH